MRVAIVHDYLREYGGAERVVETLHEMWPSAPLFTSFVDWKSLGTQAYRFRGWDIRTSWVQHNPLVKKLISPLRFLAPAIWGSFDLSEYDVVISSSGWFMCRGVALKKIQALTSAYLSSRDGQGPDLKSVHKDLGAKAVAIAAKRYASQRLQKVGSPSGLPAHNKGPLHICYIHHPPRNLYGYATGSDWQKYWPVRVYGTIVNFFLRHYDFETAQAVDFFVANSRETARRVQKFYRRDSVVIYPPVDTDASVHQRVSASMEISTHRRIDASTRSYYLSVGRLTYAKRVDLAIQACNKLKLPLKIVGTGKEEAYLRSIAGPTVEFLGSVSDSELADLYVGAKALIFCALDEDFGMVPVEAMGYGVPVIALAQGGVLETVVDGKTGVLFGKPTMEALMEAMGRYVKLRKSGEELKKQCRAQAQKFSKERFKKELKKFVEEKLHSS